MRKEMCARRGMPALMVTALLFTSSFVQAASPAISEIPGQNIDQGETTGPVSFTVSDPDTPVEGLSVTATSDNTVLTPSDGSYIVISGSGAARTITVQPDSSHSGTAKITVTVSDGTSSASSAFTVAVAPRYESTALVFLTMARVQSQQWRFKFEDHGSGATNYLLDFIPALSTGEWTNVSGVQFSLLGDGLYQADAVAPTNDAGYFRIRGLRTVTANFNSSQLQAGEDSGTLNLVIVFDGPFQGLVRYNVEGTALSGGDFSPLAGEVIVNGSTAVIPLRLIENSHVGALKFLTLRLEPGSGYRAGSTGRATITIDENDAEWQGSFLSRKAAIGFVLHIRHSEAGYQAGLKSEDFGFFPTNEVPVQISFTPNAFSAEASNIPVGANATLLNSIMAMTFRLHALNGVTNQLVSPERVEGTANLVIEIPDKPHLNTTNEGTFILVKPPIRPSTNQAQLVRVP